MKTRLHKQLEKSVAGKTILITGASSGIGLTTAHQLADAGAHVLLVSRTQETLEQVKSEIEAKGGKASIFPCDLNDMEAIDEVSKQIIASVDHIDILINNAGRSIRRAVHESVDRFHDFERTMQLNYFGAVRLVMNILPQMMIRRAGHIINISSIGVLANATRFSAYVASKAALDAFSRCLSAEVHSHKIAITSIYMPLVRTPMIAPTKIYKYVPTLSPEQAADLIAYAIVKR
ncbi:MAG: SDR family NAD(P)-dependent oxidoreductase, partial [Acinetobacter sp.]